jgi:hypothetical protein
MNPVPGCSVKHPPHLPYPTRPTCPTRPISHRSLSHLLRRRPRTLRSTQAAETKRPLLRRRPESPHPTGKPSRRPADRGPRQQRGYQASGRVRHVAEPHALRHTVGLRVREHVLLSARRVDPTGKAYGLDMTDEMLALARGNQRKAGATNVEILKGTTRMPCFGRRSACSGPGGGSRCPT